MNQAIIDLLTKHEDFRSQAYRDTTGHLTIGIGFNLDSPSAAEDCASCGLDYSALRNGLAVSLEQAQSLLALGIQRAQDVANVLISGFQGLPQNAQLVCIDMIFNLGSTGFAAFKNTIAAIEAQNWIAAATGMRDSTWYTQVGSRALDDINLILHAGD